MKRIVLFFLIFISAIVMAKEPENLAITKEKLIKYHDSGAYMNDFANVLQKAMRYLELRIKRGNFDGKPAIVLDIDETALSNYPDMVTLDFGGTVKEVQEYEDKGTDAALEPTLKLYRFAIEHHITVLFITGRFEEERAVTEDNLKKAGYVKFDKLILRSDPYRTVPAAVYKSAARKQLGKEGYDILLNVGDQKSDLQGGYADEVFKLPNPYYFIA